MLRKTIIICLALIMALGLAACGHEHEWVDANCLTPKTCTSCNETEGEALGHTWADATCIAPKTCSVCGETAGEALDHTWVEATYQAPKTCSVCNATEGEALITYFAEHGLDARVPDKAGDYNYTLTCYTDATKTTVAKVIVEDYKTIASDDTHEALDGYEWKILSLKLHISDENAQAYGFQPGCYLWTDRYKAEINDNDEEDENKDDDGVIEDLFTTGISQSIVWNGVEYNDGWLRIEESLTEWLQDETGAYYIDMFVTASVRVPVGYDGFVFGLEAAGWEWIEGTYLHEVITDNTLLFSME